LARTASSSCFVQALTTSSFVVAEDRVEHVASIGITVQQDERVCRIPTRRLRFASPKALTLGIGRAFEQQCAFSRIACERRRALECPECLFEAAELRQNVAAHARQEVIGLERRARRPTFLSAGDSCPIFLSPRQPRFSAVVPLVRFEGDGAHCVAVRPGPSCNVSGCQAAVSCVTVCCATVSCGMLPGVPGDGSRII
jgi:hypothetical protein